MEFAVGNRVSARGLAWDVTEVTQLGAQQLLHLRCTAGDMSGLEWDILHPAERVDIQRTDFMPDAPGPLAAWRLYHQARLLEQVLGPVESLAAQPGRVRIEPFQLVPLMRALELPRVRLLLADGVGLGKTIEASLIVCELIARRRAHRVLVVSPAGPLLVQWQQELRQRFGLRFVAITDASALREERRKLELGGNPFDSIALCLISLDFAKQERVLEELERSAWDIAIIDEAHHCISAAGTDREDTLRRRLAEVIAERSDGLLLLTATPHDGYDPHFASLIELLDPSLVDGRGGLAGFAYRRHVVRRLKSHIRNPLTGQKLFRDRRVIPVPVDVSDAPGETVKAFHRALAALVTPRLRRAVRTREYGDALAFVGLLKRSVSTIAACVKTLRVVADRYRHLGANEAEAASLHKERARALRAYRRQALRFGTLDAAAADDAERLEADDIAADLVSFGAEDLVHQLAAHETAEAIDWLVALGVRAEKHDPKIAVVLREVAAIRAVHPLANVLIYTEYADSQLAAMRALRESPIIMGEILAISGVDAEAERTHATERCAEEDRIILISTDSLAEGLNLQRRCCHLIHLDLPYNPNRLEQRNGRIDRYGQVHDPQIRYLYLAGTFEERLLLRLITKYEKARASLTFMPDTLGVTADAASEDAGLIAGFAERQALLFEDEASPIRTLDQVGEETNSEAYRDLLHEIDRAFDGYERTAVRHGWLADQGLNADVSQMLAADAARSRGGVLSGRIDLQRFVQAAVEMETGRVCDDPAVLRLPAGWASDMDGLPGFDVQTSELRITHDQDRSRDVNGRSVGFLGRVHPAVRRAMSCVLRTGSIEALSALDNRVSAACAAVGTAPSLLLTYSVELHSARRIEFQHVTGVLLEIHGPPVELQQPEQWLCLADNECAAPIARLWRDLFVTWVSIRRLEADAIVLASMARIAAELTESQGGRFEDERRALGQWLRLRADQICGVSLPLINDLFGVEPSSPVWRSSNSPLERLASYAADGSNPITRRREANSAVELFRNRSNERDGCMRLSPPVLRPIGMLMLVPPAFAR